MKRKKPRFIRKDWHRKSRLGMDRPKKQVWRKPKGRHTKTRLKRKGQPKAPSIGYSQPKTDRGKIHGLKPVLIHNVQELLSAKKDEMPLVSSSIGIKKKIEIAKKALEGEIRIENLDAQKFLDKIEEKMKEKEKKKGIKKKEEKKKEEKVEPKESGKVSEKQEVSEPAKGSDVSIDEEEKIGEEEKKEKEKIMKKEIQHVKHDLMKTKQQIKAPLGRLALEK